MDTNTKLVRLTADQIERLIGLVGDRHRDVRSYQFVGYDGTREDELHDLAELSDVLREA